MKRARKEARQATRMAVLKSANSFGTFRKLESTDTTAGFGVDTHRQSARLNSTYTAMFGPADG